MADDPRKGHPDYTPTDPPAPERRIMGVRVPPLKAPPPDEAPAQAPPHDPWVQRITAATALVVALSTAVWGGAKYSERDVPSSKQADKLHVALNRCESAVVKLTAKVEQGEARDAEQSRQVLVQAHAIWLLNGQVAPVYAWPEPRLSDWNIGVDSFHKHNRRGGSYPGAEE